jgi:uncharacterized protein with PQ loop repeat
LACLAATAAVAALLDAGSASAALVPALAGEEGPDVGLLLSKVLSLGVIAGSFVGKLPQVYEIWKAQSAEGVSTVSIWTEAVSMGIQFAYNVVRRTPLSTYAEVPVLFVQMLLLALVAAWADGYLTCRISMYAAALTAVTAGMSVGIIPAIVTTTLYAANVLLGLLIVAPQVALNYRTRSTGRLSFVVTAMTFCGLSTRLFTTLMEVEDAILRLTIALNWSLMAILMLQFYIYRPGKEADVDTGELKVYQMPLNVSGNSLCPVPSDTSLSGMVAKAARRSDRQTTGMDRQMSFVAAVGKMGSFHCLMDLVGDDENFLDGMHSSGLQSFADLRSFHRARQTTADGPMMGARRQSAPSALASHRRQRTT